MKPVPLLQIKGPFDRLRARGARAPSQLYCAVKSQSGIVSLIVGSTEAKLEKVGYPPTYARYNVQGNWKWYRNRNSDVRKNAERFYKYYLEYSKQ
jgi:hypothetical protein